MAEGDTGFGQQYPENSSSEFNKHSFAIERALALISTAKIVKVTVVDTAKKTVTVQPLVKMIDGTGNTSEHGTVAAIPYWIFQMGKSAVLADPVAGDIGLMICCDRDISAVKSTKAIAPPGSLRQLDIADGIYFGGLLNGAPEQWVKFTDDGMELNAKGGHKLFSTAAGGWQVDQLTVTGNLQVGGNILNEAGGELAIDIKTSGDVVAGSISVKLHHHTAQGALAPTTVAQP